MGSRYLSVSDAIIAMSRYRYPSSIRRCAFSAAAVTSALTSVAAKSSIAPFVSPFPTKWPLCGAPIMAGHCVSKQIGRHDAACQGCPRCVSRSPEARCLRVVARAVRFSRPAVLSALLVIQLFGIVIPPPYFPKEHQKERCGHSRSQRSFITFHGALRNILLSAGFPAMFHMIVLEQTFVNALLQNFFLLLLLNRIDQ